MQTNIGEHHMSKVIGFLEHVGANAAMRHASREALLRTLQDAEIENVLRQPDRALLNDLTGARETMYCLNQSKKAPKKAPAKKKPAKKAPAKKPAKKAPAKRK